MALQLRPHEGWGWVLLSGIAALAVGIAFLNAAAFSRPCSMKVPRAESDPACDAYLTRTSWS